MSKVEKMESVFSVKGDYEITCNVLFRYHPAFPGSYYEPPEPESVEIAGVEYVSGARTEIEEEGFMLDVRCQMQDESFLIKLEEVILQHVADERDAAEDAHWDRKMEAKIDAGVRCSQEEDS